VHQLEIKVLNIIVARCSHEVYPCVISGLRRDAKEICALLGFYAA